MNNSVLSVWHGLGEPAVPRLMAVESATLSVLAASLLVFRTFRERYLLLWILGWVAYLVSGWNQVLSWLPSNYQEAISQAQFVLAVGLFSSAALLYSQARKLLIPLLGLTGLVMGFAVARCLLWPDSYALRLVLEASYRFIAIVAAVEVIRFRWARWEIGPSLLSLSLLLLHLDWAPFNALVPPGLKLAIDLVSGLSVLIIVFDESKMRTRRLGVINSMTTSISRAQQYGPMMLTALAEFKKLMLAKAAWFRLLEDDKMVIVQQIGLSRDFLRDRGAVAKDDKFEQTLKDASPIVLKTSSADDWVRPYLKREQFHHIVMVPVLGKKSTIGILSLGSRHNLTYTPEELEFLATSAHQLGLAVENLRLVEQIVRSHRQWANTFDSIQDIVLVHDSEFRIMKANQALLERLGLAPADVAGQPCEKVLPRAGQWTECPYCNRIADAFQGVPDPCFGGFSMVSTSVYTEQGSELKGTIHVVRDTTERRAAEEKYRLLFEQAQEGVFVATPDGKLLDANEAFVRMLGYESKTEIRAKNLDLELYAFPEQRESLRHAVDTANYVQNFEVVLRHKNGALLTVLESCFATRDANGQVERYHGFVLDVTEKKQAENEIRRRNRELNALNTMAVIATRSFDLDEILNLTLRQVLTLLDAETGTIYLADEGDIFRRRAGWGKPSAERAKLAEVHLPGGFGELIFRSRTEVITPEFLPHLPKPVAEFIQADQLASWIWVLMWSKDKPLGVMGISSPKQREYNSNDENLLVAIGRQLATTIEKVRLYEESCRAYEDLRRAQEQLLQSEKMSAVGQLIAGVAHELNNPLTAILGYAQLLEGENLGDRAGEFISKLFKQAQRTHRVVQNLLSFARQRKPQKEEVDLAKVLEEVLALRDYDLRVNAIQLVREIEPNLPPVTGDPMQLEQVFLNVLNNAIDALLEAGAEKVIKVRMFKKDKDIHAEFHDSGSGITELNRIFEPFYTTKAVGKGTGLGLSICYGIIQEHGGSIEARNHPEGGAVLEIWLPAAEAVAPAEKVSPPPRRDLAIEGRILLVESDSSVLEFERDVLSGAGASVVASGNVEELKSLLQEQSFDALILDGKISGNGNLPDLYRWIRENCPALEKHMLVLFSSVAEPEIRAFLQENNIPVLLKPFEVGDFISQARRLLQKAQAVGAS
ncbi:MAG TPA: GAF domain-containing protein [Terriglobales bacterium]|nr:GAF domain-containing protein [Terriglobales bacterium]